MSGGSVVPDWGDVRLEGEPTMFIGWRLSNKRLEARRVSLHADTFAVLREIATGALEQLQEMEATPYSAYAHPEFGEEYVYLSTATASAVPAPRGLDLAQLCRSLESVQEVTAEDLQNLKFQFYGIAYGSGGDAVAFVRKSNPKKALQGGYKFFKFSGTLKRVENPDLVLEDSVDIVVTADTMAVLRAFSFETLAPDVNFSVSNVEQYVDDLVGALQGKLDVSSDSVEAIKSVSARKSSLVKRLKNAGALAATLDITSQSAQETVLRHGLGDLVSFDDSGKVVLAQESVEVFIDLIEGRLFEQDFTRSPARADRFRVRRSSSTAHPN